MGLKVSKKLQNEWDKKLKESGFRDIEPPSEKNGFLHKQILNLHTADITHFRACRDYLNSGKFESERDRYLFELYSDGLSYREIEKALREQDTYAPLTAMGVQKRINKILLKARINKLPEKKDKPQSPKPKHILRKVGSENGQTREANKKDSPRNRQNHKTSRKKSNQ